MPDSRLLGNHFRYDSLQQVAASQQYRTTRALDNSLVRFRGKLTHQMLDSVVEMV